MSLQQRKINFNPDLVTKPIDTVTEQLLSDQITAQLSAEIHSHVYMSEKEKQAFTLETGATIINCKHAKPYEHSIQRAMANWSYEKLRTYSSGSTNIIEVGANISAALRFASSTCNHTKYLQSKMNRPYHFAQMVTTAEDFARFTRDVNAIKSLSNPLALQITQAVQNRQAESQAHCLAGAQFCQKKADILLFNHSIYDITPAQFDAMMTNTRATEAYISIHAPYEVIFKQQSFYPNLSYEVERSNGRIIYHLKSSGSKSYQHDEENWRFWLTKFVWAGTSTYYIKEVVATLGQCWVMRIVASPFKPSTFNTKIQPPVFLQNRVFFPNFYQMMIEQKTYKPQKLSYDGSRIKEDKLLSLPITKAADMLANVMRQKTDTPNDISFQTLINQAKASNATLLIGDTILRERDSEFDFNLTRYCVSLFVMGIVQRTQSSKSVGGLLDRLKKESSQIHGFILSIHDFIDKIFSFFREDRALKRMNENYLISTEWQKFDPLTIQDRCTTLKNVTLRLGTPINPLKIIAGPTGPWQQNGFHNPTLKNMSSFVHFLKYVDNTHNDAKKPTVLYIGCAPGFSLKSVHPSILKKFNIIHVDPEDCEFAGHKKMSLQNASICAHNAREFCFICIGKFNAQYVYSDISIGSNSFDEFVLQRSLIYTKSLRLICIKMRKLEEMPENEIVTFKGEIFRQAYAKPGSSEVRMIYDNKCPVQTFTIKELKDKMLFFNNEIRNRYIDQETFTQLTSGWELEKEPEESKSSESKHTDPKEQTTDITVEVTAAEILNYIDALETETKELTSQFAKSEIDEAKFKGLMNLKKMMLAKCYNLDEGSIKIAFHNGIAGEGKSHMIKKRVGPKDLIVCPSSKLAQSYTEGKFSAITHEKAVAIEARTNVENVYVDECCMLPKVWYAMLKETYPAANIFAFGDTLQIGFVDRTDKDVAEVEWPDIFHCTVTRRCPIDATIRRPNFGYPAASTTSTEKGETEIIRSGDAVTEYLLKEYNREIPVITFYQDDKKRIKKAFPDVNVATVHESQGSTYDETYVIVTDKPAALHKKKNYMNVADTRHRKKVTYFTETTEIEELFNPPNNVSNNVAPSAPPQEEEVKVDLTKPPPVKGSVEDKKIRKEFENKKTSTENDIFEFAVQQMQKYNHKKDDFLELARIKTSIDNKIVEEGMDLTKVDSWRLIDRTHNPAVTGRLVKPSLRMRSSKAIEAVAISKEIVETKHPAAETIDNINSIAVVNNIEGMKFVEKTEDGADINIPASGDIIANNDAELPTGGSLSFMDVDYKIAQDSPMQVTATTHANIEAINTITRDMCKQDYIQDQEKIKGYVIAGGKSDNMIKLKPRGEEVESEESTFEQGFMDYAGHATRQGSSTTETVSTFLGRMGKSVVELKQIEKDATLTVLRKHMFETLPTIDEVEAAEKWDDTCTRAILDAYLKMDLKSKDVMTKAFDQATVNALEDYSVTGFNKTQWKSKVWYKVALKVGQSVSQHSKTKNMIMKFHAYVCDALLREYDGYKPFLYASGKGDAQIERKITEMMENAEEECIFIEGDFSEFDSTQNELMPILCTELLQYYTGLNNELLSTYLNHLKKWKVEIPGAMTIFGRHQKHSGEAATLLFNTLWNTVWVTALFDLKEPVVCAFKGDDSLLVAKSVKIRKEVRKLMEINGLQLKMSTNKFYGTFTDMIVTANGATIDLGRRAQKILSKSYKLTHKECQKELRESVADIVKQRIVNSQGQAAAMTNNTLVYGSELARNYCEVLINISRGDFSGWKTDAVKNVVFNLADDTRKVDMSEINL